MRSASNSTHLSIYHLVSRLHGHGHVDMGAMQYDTVTCDEFLKKCIEGCSDMTISIVSAEVSIRYSLTCEVSV